MSFGAASDKDDDEEAEPCYVRKLEELPLE